MISLIAYPCHADAIEKISEKLKHFLILYLLYHYIDMGVHIEYASERASQFLRNRVFISLCVEFAHIYTIEFYCVDVIEILDAKDIMVPDDVKVIDSDFISSVIAEFEKNPIEPFIVVILHPFCLQYLEYDHLRIYAIERLHSVDIGKEIVTLLKC